MANIDETKEGHLFNPIAVEERYVLLIGPSGGGKSEVINALCSYGVRRSRPAELNPNSVTTDAIVLAETLDVGYEGRKYVLKLYDTRGLTDSHASFAKLAPQWNQFIEEKLSLVHFVVFILPLDRVSKSLLDETMSITNALVSWGMKKENVLVVLNKCDFFKDSILEKYEAALQKVALPSILKPIRPIRTSFLNQASVIEEIAELAKLKMIEFTNRLMKLLLCAHKIKPFEPQKVVIGSSQRNSARIIGFLATCIIWLVRKDILKDFPKDRSVIISFLMTAAVWIMVWRR